MPSATIVTDPFKVTGQAMARAWGVPNFRFIAMPHPIANLNETQLDQRAREVVPDVIALLLEGQPSEPRI